MNREGLSCHWVWATCSWEENPGMLPGPLLVELVLFVALAYEAGIHG